MRQAIKLTCGVATLILAGCSVQVQNNTPSQFPATPDIGMYPVSATVTAGPLVSAGVLLFDVSGDQRIPLKPDDSGSHYRTMVPVNCASSFQVQYLAIWRLQGIATRHQLFPAQPITIRLTPPTLTAQATIDTSGKPVKRVWQGSVPYKFGTAPDTQITAAEIEPLSQSKADVASAKLIHVVSGMPIDAPCNQETPVLLESKGRSAQANLVITTTMPGRPQWTTKVVFQPKPTE